MKKLLLFLVLALSAGLLAGCVDRIDDSLPPEPYEFVMGSFVNPDDKEDEYSSVTYLERVYIPFGTLKDKPTNEDIGPCLGYLMLNNTKVEQVLFFPLKEDENNDFLVCLGPRSSKEEPVIFRAIDTVGRDLRIPEIIRPSSDKFWQ